MRHASATATGGGPVIMMGCAGDGHANSCLVPGIAARIGRSSPAPAPEEVDGRAIQGAAMPDFRRL
jgi:hypothetical protein